MAEDAHGSDPLLPYVPALLGRWSGTSADPRHLRVAGSLAFVDISGFTRLTERLAARGKVGAEQMSDMLSATFTGLLTETRDEGADLVKWGGDAMLLLFDGADHAARAARSAHRMRATLADIGRIRLPSGTVRLRMSVGVHSGDVDFFLVGDPALHEELLVSGPAASVTAAMEAAAAAGQIALSAEAAALLAPRSLGTTLPGGRLLRRPPVVAGRAAGDGSPPSYAEPGRLLPPPIRRHLLDGVPEPEHRLITVAFVQFSGTDALLEEHGPAALADALDAVVRNVQHACADHDVTFFETDINSDGGKIMLTAGAPHTSDHDEDRMLRAARMVLDRAGALPLRIGINRGHVFAGDFGPSFRRTYSVKGDAINLAARVMAKARPGQLLATVEVVERSRTVFVTEELAPFAVKGKAQPVRAAEVGRLVGSRSVDRPTVPVVGREGEMALLRRTLADAGAGTGRLVQVVGEGGMGKSRLVAELLAERPDVPVAPGACDEYGSSTPYLPFRRLLRGLLGADQGADADAVGGLLSERVAHEAAHLVPWLPLLGVAVDVVLPPTAETSELDGQFRKARLEAVVVDLLGALLTSPTILLFEDAHLMDDASADLLGHLAEQVDGRPWLVLVTRRDEPDGYVPRPGSGLTSVRLEALGAAASLELVQARSGQRTLTPAVLAALADRSGGHPLFLEALVTEATREGAVARLPESVEGLVTSQIDRLDPADRLVLRYAAVLGTAVDEAALDGLLETYDARVPAGAMTRLADFLVRDERGGLRFRNALLRDVAYEGLPYSRRETLHAHVGRAIEEAAGDPEDQCELLSLHFFHAGLHEEAWRFSVLAADRALGKFAHAEAIEFFERAAASVRPSLALDPGVVAHLFEQLADSRFLVGAADEAGRAYALARRHARDDAVHVAAITEKEARIDLRHRKFTQAMRRISRGLRRLDGMTGPPAEVARSLLARRYAYCRYSQGRIDEALRWADVARHSARGAADADALAQAHEMLNAIHAGSGRDEPEPYGVLALDAYIELGNLPRQGHCLNNLAVQAFTAGRWDEALARYRRATDLFRRIGDTASEGNTAFNTAELLVCQRRHTEAAVLLPVVLRIARAVHDDELVALALREQARTLAAMDGLDGAVAVLADARARFDALGEADEVRTTDRVLAELLLDAGRVGPAAEVLDRVTRGRTDALSAPERRVLGRHLLAEGRVPEALQSLRAGLLLAADDAHRYEEGLLLLEVAAALGRSDGDADGSDELREGRDILDAMGVLVA
ncbi:MAG TPA: adenylate/guanylate cyclase domain-containing protein [Nocardioides sp.]|nr:adenylate/guanylate cyclase domain-containing protein [Nocardioides sp.]